MAVSDAQSGSLQSPMGAMLKGEGVGGDRGNKTAVLEAIPAQQTFPANSSVREGPSTSENANWEHGEVWIWFPALPHTSRSILLAGGAIPVL